MERDLELTEQLIRTKERFGFPKQIRAAYAKNSNDRVFQIAKMLNDADMSKGVTLSFQSVDKGTLSNIKRKNMAINSFNELISRYHVNNIPPYTELIMGLPGETYESFVDGVNTLIDAGQHDSLSIYMCAILPNAEMGEPEYQQQHGIKFVRMPILQQHRSSKEKDIVEYNDIIVETKTLSLEDWKRTYLFSWAVQTFHCLALTQYIAIFLRNECQISYADFYQDLIEFCKQYPKSTIGNEYFLTLNSVVERALDGHGWDVVLPRYGYTIWPTEEASFLKITENLSRFYADVFRLIKFVLGKREKPWHTAIENLFEFQRRMIRSDYRRGNFSFKCDYNFGEYFRALYAGKKIELKQGQRKIHVSNPDSNFSGKEDYARRVVWYGRKGGARRYTQFREEEVFSYL